MVKISSNKEKLNLIKSDKVKSHEVLCFYCGNIIDRIKSGRRLFCSNECVKKYYKGVYKKLWAEGDQVVNPDDKPIIISERRYK